ncbi:hypothetical protein HA402_005568 [Bradysia odoriphaga]|nr:hypothetical protein HA402_005568 [Bradysia odoriphaga]
MSILNGVQFEDVSRRYSEKVALCETIDPYTINMDEPMVIEDLPKIRLLDIWNYLTSTKTTYSKEEFMANKALGAHQFFESGWVRKIVARRLPNNKVVVVGLVEHSQRINEAPLKPWVLCYSTGLILAAHCNCKAGLGEACSHVGGILYAVETLARSAENEKFSKEEVFHWLKENKEKSNIIAPLTLVTPGLNVEFVKLNVQMVPEMDDICSSSDDSIATTEYDNIIRLTLVNTFYKSDFKGKGLEDLLEIARSITVNIPEKYIKMIESLTVTQKNYWLWEKHRVGRITGSTFKSVCRTNLKKPAKSTIMKICYPEKTRISSKAIQYGNDMEPIAKKMFIENMQKSHTNFSCVESGLVIDPLCNFFAASPDGTCTCDCCGKYLVEIKCPFSMNRPDPLQRRRKTAGKKKMKMGTENRKRIYSHKAAKTNKCDGENILNDYSKADTSMSSQDDELNGPIVVKAVVHNSKVPTTISKHLAAKAQSNIKTGSRTFDSEDQEINSERSVPVTSDNIKDRSPDASVAALANRIKLKQTTVPEDQNITSDSDMSDEIASDSPDLEQDEHGEKEPAAVRWILEEQFESKVLLDGFLQHENCWSYRGCSNSTEGKKVLYRCNRVKQMAKEQCEAGVYVVEKLEYVKLGDVQSERVQSEDTRIVYMLYRKNREHTHDKSPDMVKKVSEAVKRLIIEQFLNAKKPKKISYNLMDNPNLQPNEIPSYKQIVCVVNAYKKSGFGEAPITMRQLTKFVENHSRIPEQMDDAFVVGFERSPRNQQSERFFRLFISTPRLLEMAANAKFINADATHGLTTEKVSLLAFGLTDMNTKFHFTGLTLSNHEATDDYSFSFHSLRKGVRSITGTLIQPTVLICDADGAIHNGFESVFGNDHLVIMCYFHVLLNVQTKYKFENRKNLPKIKEDLRILHMCDTERKFDVGCDLFVKKWRRSEPEVSRLLHKSFFNHNKNWFMGCAVRTPKHNNGTETWNSTMKRCQTEHQRQPFKQFLSTSLAIVRQRSKEYIQDREPYSNELQISKEIIREGRAHKIDFVHLEKDNGEVDFFTFRSGIDRKITLKDVVDFQAATYKSFEEFSARAFDVWKISFPKESGRWKQAVCTCPAFDRNYICKHIISIAESIGLFKESDDVDNEDYDDEPLFHTKRGRPPRTTKALVYD